MMRYLTPMGHVVMRYFTPMGHVVMRYLTPMGHIVIQAASFMDSAVYTLHQLKAAFATHYSHILLEYMRCRN